MSEGDYDGIGKSCWKQAKAVLIKICFAVTGKRFKISLYITFI